MALAAAFVVVELFIGVFYNEHREHIPGRNVVVVSSLLMFALGFWDDLRPLGAKRKLLGQVLISLLVCAFGLGIQRFKIPFTDIILDLHGWGWLITILWLVAMTNLINLVDGVDGLAGGICLMLMALLSYVGYMHGSFVLLTAGMAGALLGFLRYNFPPARIYMGDGGAYFLGFQIGLFSITSSQKGTIFAAMVAPLFVLALPIVDVAIAILRRGLRGLPLFRADRSHLHHHLMSMGLSRRRVVVSIYAITLIFLLLGFAAIWSRGQMLPVLFGIAGLILLLCAGKLSFSREWFAVGRVLGNSLGMRQEVQYALCLTRWLEMEGGRRSSIESLWQDLAFVAQRLGFSFVKLTLADGVRVWEQPDSGSLLHSSRYELQGGRCGTLELKASCANSEEPSDQQSDDEAVEDGRTSCPLLADAKLFSIMGELVAEGWLNATKDWEKANQLPLRFTSRSTPPRNKPHRRAPRPFAPPPVLKDSAEGSVSR
ncbi:MAG: hypothetical protein DME25_13325 [Verrucomicrobia bacterium]|nr:MAG: hypothetical protein DME25_13325 [Verrucomicrobiota bacterium]